MPATLLMQSAPRDDHKGYQAPVYGVALAIFAAALLLRAFASDAPINIDEAHWLRRGIAFYRALVEGNLAVYRSLLDGSP